LAEQPQRTTFAGEDKAQIEPKSRILQFAWALKTDGKSEKTIRNYVQCLNLLIDNAANLYEPETVKAVIATKESWSSTTKVLVTAAYHKFAEHCNIKWKMPKYRACKKIPFIPLESEIDALIAACGRKTSVVLQIMKETAMRCGEAVRLEWKDIDGEQASITLNLPEKNGIARMFKVPNKLISMVNSLPKKSKGIFGSSPVQCQRSLATAFYIQRKRVAMKLQNPRLLQIHFHTLRHWKATMEYAKTKDILHVMKLLGHRKIDNTLVYTQLISFESNDYHSAVAKTVEEAKKLIEAGFEYVCDMESVSLFRKRK
jgi:integrase